MRLNYANVVSTLALVLALGTGGAWAATTIHGKLLKKNTVTGSKLKKNTLTTREINEAKLKAVPRAVSADSVLGQTPAALLAGGTAGNANQLGGIGPEGFVKGNGSRSAGRTVGQSANPSATIRTFQTSVGEFRLSCGPADADVRYVNTTSNNVDVIRTIVGGGSTGTTYASQAPNSDVGFAATNGTGPAMVELRAGQGDSAAAFARVGVRREGLACIWHWEVVTP